MAKLLADNEQLNKENEHLKSDQALQDDLERMIAQEIAAKTIDDATRQAFEEEKKRATQATSITKLNTVKPSISASNSPLVSTASTPYASAASTPTGANTGGSSFIYLGGQIPIDASTLPNADLPIDLNMPDLEDDSNVFPNNGIFSGAYDDEDVGAKADFNNMDNTIDVSPIPTLRVHRDHPKGQILGDPKSAHVFSPQEEPKTISQALKDESWVEAMQEELLQFELQKVWILVDLPFRKKAIGTKWVFRNKRDERSIVDREDVYVHQPPGFVDPVHPNKVYKVKQQPDGIFISQDKSMIGSLMYLTASRPDIIFVVCVYARFQVTPKASHLNVVKRIFSEYGGASIDKNSTTCRCQFLGRRLISWQCKKQTIVANSTTQVEYVAAANCCGQDKHGFEDGWKLCW
ncbi:hypothetical protein Tco_1297859 [Tanacetum coccineum]